MGKRKITKRQAERIAERQRAHSEIPTEQATCAAPSTENSEIGTVITHYGNRVEILRSNKEIISCFKRQNLGALVTGDQVMWQFQSEDKGVVISLLPRHSLLSYNVDTAKARPVVANADCVVIVLALHPMPSSSILDRYLVAAALADLEVIIVFNKIDLRSQFQEAAHSWETELNTYAELGYPCYLVSAHNPPSLLPLIKNLQHKTSIFLGQSGAGKSSLIGALTPHEVLKVGDLSEKSGLGRHTTTHTRLYFLPEGGTVIDSPGIRQFELGNISDDALAHGFKEFRDYLGQCRFRNCQHQNTPGCALEDAVKLGKITRPRWQNFMLIRAEKNQTH